MHSLLHFWPLPALFGVWVARKLHLGRKLVRSVRRG
jgi:hypothetical protein